MRRAALLLPVLLLAWQQDPVKPLKKENDCWKGGKTQPWEGYNKGVKWTQPRDKAFAEAKRAKKLVLVFNLVGDLDKGGCWAAGSVMRTVTFSDESASKLVNDGLVSTWINRKPGFHNCDQRAEQGIATRACFATKNFCTFLVTPDEKVLHYFSGYFGPEMFRHELEFAKTLAKEALDEKGRIRADRYRALHEEHAREHDEVSRPPKEGAKASWIDPSRREGLTYLSKVHRALGEKTTTKLDEVLNNYLSGNNFTEE